MCWLFVLAVVMRTGPGRPGDSDTGVGYRELKRILTAFKNYLRELHDTYAYPGLGPSARLAFASSRLAYLYGVFQYKDSVTELLDVVQKLVSALRPVAYLSFTGLALACKTA